MSMSYSFKQSIFSDNSGSQCQHTVGQRKRKASGNSVHCHIKSSHTNEFPLQRHIPGGPPKKEQ